MYEVKVNKTELLTILKTNRQKHQEIYIKAFDGYRKEVIRHLQFALDQASAGEKIITQISLIAPQDHTAEYDRVIGMLKMCVDEKI